jgi:predicted dehydrogenase
MQNAEHISRRQFLTSTAATALFGSSLFGAAPNADSRIKIAFIGYGKRCQQVLGRALRQKDVCVVAVCEVEATRLAKAKEIVEKQYAADIKSGSYTSCATYVDYRKLLQRDDLQAVVIMTPDHTHTHISLAAAAKKLDIYCEKPLTHNIAEGRMLANAVAKKKIIFQTGSQQRCEFEGIFYKAVQMIRSGAIGEVKKIEIGVGGPARPCDLPEQAQPENLDWDLWLGPAPLRPYNEKLCPQGLHSHFPDFRKYEEYAGGTLADMGAHFFDIVQWALGMDQSGPVSIEPPVEGETGLKFTYANGVEMTHGGVNGCTFIGTKGTLWVDRSRIKTEPASILSDYVAREDGGAGGAPTPWPKDHLRNWLDCIKSREDPICPVETGHRSATVCHLANIGYKLRRKLTWDPVAEKFTNDDEANALTSRTPRKGWPYPVV